MPLLVPDDLLDKEAFDVNGHHLGHVVLTREAGGEILSFDIALDFQTKRVLETPRDVITVDPAEVVATDFDVTLAEEGRYLAHPERAPPRQV